MKYNLSIWNLTNETFFNRECVGQDFYTVECLNKNFCPQLQSYFVNTGIYLVVGYLILNFVTTWFFYSGYKFLGIESLKNKDLNLKWQMWVKDHMITAFLIYVVVVIYLNI